MLYLLKMLVKNWSWEKMARGADVLKTNWKKNTGKMVWRALKSSHQPHPHSPLIQRNIPAPWTDQGTNSMESSAPRK